MLELAQWDPKWDYPHDPASCCFVRASVHELSTVCVRLYRDLAREPGAVQGVPGHQSAGWGTAMPQRVSVFGPREQAPSPQLGSSRA